MGNANILAYRRVGNKDSDLTLVFLHGSTMTKEGMLPLAEEFQNYNCVSFDLTGHGESDGKVPNKISTFAEDVETSIQHLQQQKIVSNKIVLLGYSMGGAITCEVAIRKNLKLSGIVLLSSGGDLKHYSPLIDELKAMPVEQFKTEDILGELFGTNTPKSDMERISALYATTKVPDSIGYSDLITSNGHDHLEACKEIAIPALMVHGNDDKIVLPMAAIETWKSIENSQLLMIPHKGHAVIYEDISLVKDKILSFLTTCIQS